jgi:hypothetical protein
VGDRFVLFANHPKVLRDAITNVQAPGLNLDSSDAYQDALRRLPGRQIGALFVNLPQLGAWVGDTASLLNVDPSDRLYESLLVAFELDRQGVLAETALLPAPGQTFAVAQPALSAPVNALQFIPAGSPLSASGENLAQLWDQTSSELAGYGILSSLINQSLVGFEALQNPETSKEVLGWAKGEYALGLLPTTGSQQPDWIFAAQRSPDIDSAIAKLDAIAQQQGLSIGPLTLDGQRILAWTRLSTSASSSTRRRIPLALQAEVKGTHSTVGNYEVFASSVEAMNTALSVKQNSVLNAYEFQQAIAAFDNQNDGYLYVDWPQVRSVLEQRVPLIRLAEVVAKPLFDHLQSLTISSYGSESTLRRGAILIELKNT